VHHHVARGYSVAGGADMNERLNTIILLVVIGTLSLTMTSVIFVLLAGLFDNIVDNSEIFKILGPAFQTIVGAFVGVLGGRAMKQNEPK
jgi:O-antigen/teichoic acid export membrane protein